MNRAHFTQLFALVFAVLPACSTDAGGPRPVTVAVRVTDEQGLDEAATCMRLPVLLGSRVREVTEVPSGFGIELTATRDWVEVRFPGAMDPGLMRATEEQLKNGHADNLALVDTTGAAHAAYLSAGCTRVSAEP